MEVEFFIQIDENDDDDNDDNDDDNDDNDDDDDDSDDDDDGKNGFVQLNIQRGDSNTARAIYLREDPANLSWGGGVVVSSSSK